MANTKAALDVRIRAVFEEHGRASKEGGGKRLGAAELAAALDADNLATSRGSLNNGSVVRSVRGPRCPVQSCKWMLQTC